MPGTEALRNLICHTHKLIVVVNINHTAHTHTHSQYNYTHGWGLSKVGGAVPPHFQSGGAPPPLPPLCTPACTVPVYTTIDIIRTHQARMCP